MPNAAELYGSTQVRELKFSKADVTRIVLDHVRHSLNRPYDFDYERPIVIQEPDGGLILRYVQSTITVDRESRLIGLTLEQVKARDVKTET